MTLRRFFFLCWISAAALLPAQNLDETLRFAQDQAESGNIALALKTYQRALFFAKEKPQQQYCQRRLAQLHATIGETDRAIFYLDLLWNGDAPDSLRFEALFDKAGLLLLLQHPEQALIALHRLPQNLPEPWASRQRLYFGAGHFGIREFDLVRDDLIPLCTSPSDSLALELCILHAKKFDRKRPGTARWLSACVPGAGQCYAGDWKEGLNSFLLNAAMIALYSTAGGAYGFFDATVTVAPWMVRYYIGGIRRAGETTERRKEEKLRKVFLEILEVLQKSEK